MQRPPWHAHLHVSIWLHWQELWDRWVKGLLLDLKRDQKKSDYYATRSKLSENMRSDLITSQPRGINNHMPFFPFLLSKLSQWLTSRVGPLLDPKIRLFVFLDILKTAAKVPSLWVYIGWLHLPESHVYLERGRDALKGSVHNICAKLLKFKGLWWRI